MTVQLSLPLSTARERPRGPGTMHAPRLETSLDLQRLLRFLMDGSEHSTRDISRGLELYAVNSWVNALDFNGYPYNGKWLKEPRRFVYWLPPETIAKAERFFKERG